MKTLAHGMMKYATTCLICIFFVLCAVTVKHVIQVDLPSDVSVRVANLSTDVSAHPHSIHACSLENGVSFEDLGDVILNTLGMKFFSWIDATLVDPGVCPLIRSRALLKIPIT